MMATITEIVEQEDTPVIQADPPVKTEAETAAEAAAATATQEAAAAAATAEAEAKIQASAKAASDAALAKAIADGVSLGLRQAQPGKDRPLGRSIATTQQLLEAKYAKNPDGSDLSDQQKLTIDTEIERRHEEEVLMAKSSAKSEAKAEAVAIASVSSQFPEMADAESALYQAVVASIQGGDPMQLHPKALMIAAKAAALDLGLLPVSKRGTAAQGRTQTLAHIQAAQAAGSLTVKGSGGTGGAAGTGTPDYLNMSWKDLEKLG